MIIKSMSRKSPSFGQLIEYFHKEVYDGAPSFSHNLYSRAGSWDQIREEFEENATFLPKRKNGNFLYHEVITLEKDLPVSKDVNPGGKMTMGMVG